MPESPKNSRSAIAIALFAIAFFVTGVWQLQDQIVDDGFIFIRLAQNFSDGHGIVWNVGEQASEGATNFLHFIALSALLFCGIEPVLASLVLSSACALAIFYLVTRGLREKLGPMLPAGIAILAIYLVDERITIDAASGGLGSLIDGLAAVGVWLAANRQLKSPTSKNALLLGVAAFITCIARPTGALFTAIVYAVLLVNALVESGTDKARLRAWLIAAGITAVGGASFAAFKLATFGYLLPNSYYLKSGAEFETQWGALGGYLLHAMTPLAIPLLTALAFTTRAGFKELFAGPHSKTRFWLTLLPPLFVIAYYVAKTVVAVSNFRFFFSSYVFFFVGLVALLPACRRGTAKLRNGALFASALVALAFVAVRGHTDGLLQFPPAKVEMTPLVKALKNAGQALATTELGHDATMLNDSAGAAPYFSNFRHIDRGGLVTNELSGREPITALEREEFVWSQDLDVYLGWEPQASQGAETFAEDPFATSQYVKICLVKDARDQTSIRSFAPTREMLHLRMRELRDNWRLLGQLEPASYFENAWGVKLLAYVRRDSDHRPAITKALDPLIEVRPRDIDWESVSDGSEKLYLKKLFKKTNGDFAKMAKIMLGDRRLASLVKANCRRLKIN